MRPHQFIRLCLILAFAAAFAAAALRPPPPRASIISRSRSAAISMAEKPTPGKKERKRGKLLWGRIRERFRESEGEIAEDDGDADVAQLLEGVSKDIDTALSTRRRRLNAKLGASLKTFREDVLDEVELQADENRERQARLKARQQSIQDSLKALRQDLLDEIEDGLAGVQRGGRTLEKALRDMRTTWEDEVNELVEEAKADVDLAVADLEEAIDKQKDEWNMAISSFDGWWGSQGPRPRFNITSSFNATSAVSNVAPLQKLEIDRRVADVKRSIDEISDEVESDLKLFKSRWEVTTDRVGDLPKNLPKLNSLAAARMYVADTIFAGDVPALLTERSRIYQSKSKELLEAPLGKKKRKAGGKGALLDKKVVRERPPLVQGSDPLGLREAIRESDDTDSFNPVLRPTSASNLRLPGRYINIVTTAALPWMTGTSINPLLRAAYLSKSGYNVTLMVPWLSLEQQPIVFPEGLTFDRPALQEQYLRWWCENRASVSCPNLRIRWYPARYAKLLGCIIQDIDDISTIVPANERDAVILEEPEHLNWYHHGNRWTDVYKHVVGIAHTNYLQYARFDNNGMVKSGIAKEAFTKVMNDVVCAAHTDIVVKLSATLPDVPGENLVCNVHGVRAEFLAIGRAITERQSGAYFLGKADFTKGYREMIDNLRMQGDDAELPHIDTYGSGKDYDEIVAEIDKNQLPITPHAGIDHAHPAMHGYRVFINPSTSDVLCTATAEALAMGKKVVIPDHPSNRFFKQFKNC